MATKQTTGSANKTAAATAEKAQAAAEQQVQETIAQAQEFATEVPAFVRDATEKALEKSRETYETLRKTAEDNTAAVEDSVSKLSEGLRELNLKTLNAAEQQTLAGFDFFKKALEAKSVSELAQLQSAFVRDRFEAATSYSKDLQESTREVFEKSAQPLRTHVEKAFQARA